MKTPVITKKLLTKVVHGDGTSKKEMISNFITTSNPSFANLTEK